MLLVVWSKGDLQHFKGDFVSRVGFPVVPHFRLSRLKAPALRVTFTWSEISYNLLLGSKCLEKQAGKEITHTQKVTLMLSATCWHMAASHTKLKPLNFPLVFQNCSGCCSFGLVKSVHRPVEEMLTEHRPKIVKQTEVGKTDFGFTMFAQMALMEKNAQCLISLTTTLIT